MKLKAQTKKQKKSGKVQLRDLKSRKDPKAGTTSDTSDYRCHIHPN